MESSWKTLKRRAARQLHRLHRAAAGCGTPSYTVFETHGRKICAGSQTLTKSISKLKPFFKRFLYKMHTVSMKVLEHQLTLRIHTTIQVEEIKELIASFQSSVQKLQELYNKALTDVTEKQSAGKRGFLVICVAFNSVLLIFPVQKPLGILTA